MPAPMVSPPLVNNMYHNQVQHPHVVIPSIIQHPGYVLPPNMVCYASPPIQATYPQQIIIPGQYYPIVTTQQMATSVTYSEHDIIQHNGSMQLPVEEPEIEDISENIDEQEPVTTELISNQNHVEPKINTNEEVSPQPAVQNGLKTTPSPSVGKSWASLFNSSNASPQQNGFANNNEDNVEKTKLVVENEVVNAVCPIKHPKKSAQFVDPDCYRMGGKP